MVALWARIGSRFLPPTIHPMVVHFPIALLYLTLLADVLALARRGRGDQFWDRTAWWLLSLALVSLVAAALAGIVSESFVHWNSKTRAILSAHQRDATLTGLFALAAWVVQTRTRFAAQPTLRGRRLRRGRVSGPVLALVLGAVVMVSITGTLGGTMVYRYGVGIRGVTRAVPSSPAATATTARPVAGGGHA